MLAETLSLFYASKKSKLDCGQLSPTTSISAENEDSFVTQGIGIQPSERNTQIGRWDRSGAPQPRARARSTSWSWRPGGHTCPRRSQGNGPALQQRVSTEVETGTFRRIRDNGGSR